MCCYYLRRRSCKKVLNITKNILSLFFDRMFNLWCLVTRMLLAVSIVCLPLLCVSWASGLILGSESGDRRNVLSAVLSGSVALHAAAATLGYIAFNIRVRDNLRRYVCAVWSISVIKYIIAQHLLPPNQYFL